MTSDFLLKDSGKRQEFSTGAVRDTEDGKINILDILEYLPVECLVRVAAWYKKGAEKYSKDNWKKGIPTRRFLSSACRHLYLYVAGHRDEDHLSAVVFNVLGVIWNELKGGEKIPEKK